MSGESVCLVLFKENCRRWDQTIHDKHAKYRDTRVIPIFRFCLERRSIECITFGSRLYHLFMTPNPFCWKKLWIKGEPFSRICCTSTYIQYFSELCYCTGSIMVISISVCILWTTWIPSYTQNIVSGSAYRLVLSGGLGERLRHLQVAHGWQSSGAHTPFSRRRS